MIIVRLLGGLGNQMFQYATALNLAISNKTILKIDVSYLENLNTKKYTYRPFELSLFDIDSNAATKNEILKFTVPCFKWRKLSHLGNKIYRRNVFCENEMNSVACLPRNCYLIGNWQNESYFLSIKTLLKHKVFSFPAKYTQNYKDLINLMKNNNSVSVHFRRGDYITNNLYKNHHNTLSLEYYQKAFELIKRKVKDPVFFLFSDDKEWLEKKFKNKANIFIVKNAYNDLKHKDFFLMTQCKHSIIANSSYSWWGAWLSEETDSVSIAPQKWFVAGDKNNIVPDRWIKI